METLKLGSVNGDSIYEAVEANRVEAKSEMW
jgi:hypothetical protein